MTYKLISASKYKDDGSGSSLADITAAQELKKKEQAEKKRSDDIEKARSTLKNLNPRNQKQRKDLEKFIEAYKNDSDCAELCEKIKQKLEL